MIIVYFTPWWNTSSYSLFQVVDITIDIGAHPKARDERQEVEIPWPARISLLDFRSKQAAFFVNMYTN